MKPHWKFGFVGERESICYQTVPTKTPRWNIAYSPRLMIHLGNSKNMIILCSWKAPNFRAFSCEYIGESSELEFPLQNSKSETQLAQHIVKDKAAPCFGHDFAEQKDLMKNMSQWWSHFNQILQDHLQKRAYLWSNDVDTLWLSFQCCSISLVAEIHQAFGRCTGMVSVQWYLMHTRQPPQKPTHSLQKTSAVAKRL